MLLSSTILNFIPHPHGNEETCAQGNTAPILSEDQGSEILVQLICLVLHLKSTEICFHSSFNIFFQYPLHLLDAFKISNPLKFWNVY